MEELKFGEYLSNPKQIQEALDLLDECCSELGFEELYSLFEETLGIKHHEGFPITAIVIGGSVCRARLNTSDFKVATSIDQIGVNPNIVSQGRANPVNRSVFYGANTKKTAAFEVLQGCIPGEYVVTIGCWNPDENGLRVVNFIDGADPDFKKIPFAHSMPKEYLQDWPELPRKSAILLIDYFREKFKAPYVPGLYNITNIISGFCYSLQEIDGIGYASLSDNFEGFNIAIKDSSKLECVTVERWGIKKIDENTHQHKLLQTGNILPDGKITW